MFISRQLVRVLSLALPLSVAAYSQATLQYGVAVATGSTAGVAAGKKASDALTGAMNQAAGAAQTAASTDVAAAEAAMAAKSKAVKQKDIKPSDAKTDNAKADYKSIAKPASMPPAAEAVPLPIAGSKARAVKETKLVASAERPVSPATGKPVTRVRSAAKLTPVLGTAKAIEPVAVDGQPMEMPLSMRWELANFRPTLEPIAARAQRIPLGYTREDLKRVLGSPASKVTIPGDRDVNEIYYYQEKGQNVAVIRLEAGAVTKVTVDSL